MLASRGPDVLSHQQTTHLGSSEDAAAPPRLPMCHSPDKTCRVAVNSPEAR